MIRVPLVMAAFMVFVVATPQAASAEEAVNTSTSRHDTTATGEVGTAYFRYH